ncbi:MAG: alpha/beta hydrolase fold domain-containing protein [Solirubrobacteraceae bacterium]|nr:alpha/beta hydrolase fold domain-containing protein [Solirubrobacteraceae bacterium]
MSRRATILLSVLVAFAVIGGVIVATSGKGRTNPAEAAPSFATQSPAAPSSTAVPEPTPAADEAPTATGAKAPEGVDPNDPAFVLNDEDPCVSPCSKLDVTYGSATSVLNPDAGRQSLALDLFRSRKTPKRDAPVVILLHGGGFVEGNRTIMRVGAEQLANAGFLVASIQYRLVPRERNNGAPIAKTADILVAAEEATEDTQMAMRYIRRHAKELGATKTKDRYAVGGYSAGAITAMRVALRGGDKATPASRRWKLGAAFGISGFECGRWTKEYGCKAAYDEADPPIQVFHGEADSIVSFSWGRDTCEEAQLKGGGCQGYYYPENDHLWSSGTMFGGAKGLTKRRPAIFPTVATFLKKELAA